VDVTRGTIRLNSGDTKTGEGQVSPMKQALTPALKSATTYLECAWVFVNPARAAVWQASPAREDPRYHATSIGHAFATACTRAQVRGSTFHDLWHTLVTNARLPRVDPVTAMKITGHKTMAVFKRYNPVDEGDLRQAIAQMDTDMDTSPAMDTPTQHVSHGNT